MNVLHIINEPMATAIAYGLDKKVISEGMFSPHTSTTLSDKLPRTPVPSLA